ncbi:ABC transporter ATP-binding protein [Phenylobacterium aquaticum]|uniref:ABC transporter ATP-binding protein n=1 Tax=Phenylobacterium aquaticum TaxID=1763816 RepID=UPI0026EB7C62|nr:ABC transporter ATP-binding protein [Phenylobacterium aquaticum]
MTDFTDDEDDNRPRDLSNTQVLGFMWRHWMEDRGRFLAMFALLLGATFCDLSIPWATRGLVNAVSAPVRRADVAWIAWATLSGLYLAFYMMRLNMFRLSNAYYTQIMARIVTRAFRRVQAFSADWHASNFAGATVRRVSRAMWGYDSASDGLLWGLIPTFVVLAGLSISIGLRWPLAGVFVALLAAVFAAYNVLALKHYYRPANLVSNGLDSGIGAALADAISANPVVKSFGAEGREAERFEAHIDRWRVAQTKTWMRGNDIGFGQNILLVGLQAGLTGFLVDAWVKGHATPGDVAFAVTSFIVMAGYMRTFSENTRMLQKGLDDMVDVAGYMRAEPQLGDMAGARPLRPTAGAVVFDHVTFGYERQTYPLYENFSLAIAPGERVALVGPTGAGKSTFVKLVQRLYDVQEGRILIDGQNVAQVTQESLRRAIAVVPQDPALFHRSIAENIAYARPGATLDEIIAAAQRARAHDFIARLPGGYDTMVGERGVKLSGGERQRVAIARAFLADAPILVLDEATSSLDVETERQVQAAMEELMTARTTVVIAHRLSTIRHADRILVFEDGRIVEEGRHLELVKRGGAYARLHAVTEAFA